MKANKAPPDMHACMQTSHDVSVPSAGHASSGRIELFAIGSGGRISSTGIIKEFASPEAKVKAAADEKNVPLQLVMQLLPTDELAGQRNYMADATQLELALPSSCPVKMTKCWRAQVVSMDAALKALLRVSDMETAGGSSRRRPLPSPSPKTKHTHLLLGRQRASQGMDCAVCLAEWGEEELSEP
jgi:hypothetical protein